jgi:uncharacterized membrane protein
MAIQDSQKIDYLWKKLGYGSTKTDTNTNKKEPNEAIASPLILRGDKVWQQAESIPAVMPGSSAGVVTVYTTSAPDETTLDGTATANRSWKTGLTDWIPPELGSTYQVKVYIHTSGDASGASGGDQVFATGSGNDDEWFFDYQSGVLHFIGDNLPDGISFTGKSVYISGARYTGTFGVGSSQSNTLGNLTVDDTTLTSTTAGDDIIIDAESGLFKISGTDGFVVPIGTTAQRPGSPTNGTIRYNSSTEQLEIYDGSAWDGLSDSTSAISSETFDGDGSTTAFTLASAATTNTIFVSMNGTLQIPSSAYTVSGTTLTFTEAPATGDKIEVRKITETQSVSALTNDSGNAYIQTNSDALGTVDIVGTEVNLTGIIKQPPTTKAADATGTAGQIAWDANYIYICTATNTWKRVALTGGY